MNRFIFINVLSKLQHFTNHTSLYWVRINRSTRGLPELCSKGLVSVQSRHFAALDLFSFFLKSYCSEETQDLSTATRAFFIRAQQPLYRVLLQTLAFSKVLTGITLMSLAPITHTLTPSTRTHTCTNTNTHIHSLTYINTHIHSQKEHMHTLNSQVVW